MVLVRDLWEAAVYAWSHQVDGMAFCLLRDEPEEAIIQSLGCHGKDAKISTAGIVCRFLMTSIFCLNEIITRSQESASRNHYYLPLLWVLLRYTGYKKNVKTMNKKVVFYIVSFTVGILNFPYVKQHCLYSSRVHGLVYTTCAKEIPVLFITTIKFGFLPEKLSASSEHSLNFWGQGPKISIEYCFILGMPQ